MKTETIAATLERSLVGVDADGLKRMVRAEAVRAEGLRRLLCAALDAVGHPVRLKAYPREYAEHAYVLDFEDGRPGVPTLSTRPPGRTAAAAAAGPGPMLKHPADCVCWMCGQAAERRRAMAAAQAPAADAIANARANVRYDELFAAYTEVCIDLSHARALADKLARETAAGASLSDESRADICRLAGSASTARRAPAKPREIPSDPQPPAAHVCKFEPAIDLRRPWLGWQECSCGQKRKGGAPYDGPTPAELERRA